VLLFTYLYIHANFSNESFNFRIQKMMDRGRNSFLAKLIKNNEVNHIIGYFYLFSRFVSV